MTIKININGSDIELDVPRDTPLIYLLRNDLQLNGAKFGCGIAQCGACTVLMNGKPVRSCVMPVGSVVGSKVVTLEGLGDRETPHPLQTAFIKMQAMQCGYCSSGIIMQAAALLEKNPNPSDEQIRSALRGNLCRCGTHGRIVKAISEAARDPGTEETS
ncbi:MAG: (2Fe-2S)-binding protein [Woeseiaceae bacterium]|nr:(2Fe-2S)-binding protein [Woeseiaceae bacterium]